MSSDSVLATIDNAIEDWETSRDAMRWTPEPPHRSLEGVEVTLTDERRIEALYGLPDGMLTMEFDTSRLPAWPTAERVAEIAGRLGWTLDHWQVQALSVFIDGAEICLALTEHLPEVGLAVTDYVARRARISAMHAAYRRRTR